MASARLDSKLIMCNVPTSNSEMARQFYGVLLGSDDFVRGLNDKVESYSRPISQDGIDLSITQRFDDRESFTCYFAVENLDRAVDKLISAGGTLIVKPQDVTVSGPKKALEFFMTQIERRGDKPSKKVGRMAVLLDPDGNHVGLMQLEETVQRHFRSDKFQRHLERDQIEELDQGKLISSLFK